MRSRLTALGVPSENVHNISSNDNVSIFRCALHTTAVSNSRYSKGTFKYVPLLIPQEKITHNPLKALKAHRTGGRGLDGNV